jgi:acyl-CoA synthetase (NDP forming)
MGIDMRAWPQALLAPRSVAIIGQSNDAGKTTGRPLRYLRQAGFDGPIYGVNARRDTVLGERAWPSVAALPEVPDHVYIVLPTEAVIEAVEDCGRAGVAVATILANGFTEAGPEGEARAAQLVAAARRHDIRIVGPSSLGVVNLQRKLLLTANAAFAEPDLPVGRIFAVSQSGSLIGAMVSRGKVRGIGFAGLISIGNEVDLSVGEICAATLDDPGIDSYLLFLESLRNAAALRAFAMAAAARGRPVIAYKLGRSATARELAVSHTGALAGDDDVAEAFLADCGIARVDTFDALIEGLPLLRRVAIRPRDAAPPSIGVVTTTGGGAMMVVDRLAADGLRVEGPSEATRAKLAATGVDVAEGRLVDLTTAGTRYDVMKAALDALLTAPEFDMVVAVVGSSARFHPELAVKPIVDCASAAKPLAAFLAPEAMDALRALNAAGVPSFHTPEACADAIMAAFRRRQPKEVVVVPAVQRGSGRLLDAPEANALLDRLGVARAPAVVIEAASGTLPTLSFPYPVAVKVLAGEVAHKTDVGGLELGIADDEALRAAIGRVRARLPGTDHLLIQPMVKGLGEVLVGFRRDREVGPIVLLAVGGIHAELHRDRSLRLAPVDLAEAQAMIGEVRAMRMFAGYRGAPRGDLAALARAIVALSQLATSGDPAVAEAEVNPLMLMPAGQGAVAVDVLVKLL